MVFSALVVAGLSASTVEADSIVLYNTGVNDSGGLLAGGTADQHYTLISSPNGATAVVGASYPNPWLANDAESQWIGPGINLNNGFPGGDYVYRTTFDLTGFDLATVLIIGGLASDNDAEVFLNGSATGIVTNFSGFSSLTPFTLSSGFVAGVNTLDFRVYEPGGSPTGLRVNLSGTASTPSAVPEPASAIMLGVAGLGLLSFARHRKPMLP